jgi:Holliday junction resolvasome RuvABC endonuclease subunit
VIVVGIDPSLTKTGIAVIEGGEIRTARSTTQKTDSTPREVRRRIRTSLRRTLDQMPAAGLFVIEGPSMASKFGQPHERAGLFWFLVDQLLPRGEVVVVSPKGRAKYATGNGNADKADVKRAMKASFPGVPIPDDNVADALALALMGVRHLGAPLDVAGPKQLEAFAAVAWPRIEG